VTSTTDGVAGGSVRRGKEIERREWRGVTHIGPKLHPATFRWQLGYCKFAVVPYPEVGPAAELTRNGNLLAVAKASKAGRLFMLPAGRRPECLDATVAIDAMAVRSNQRWL
jgi:hypothetical protein